MTELVGNRELNSKANINDVLLLDNNNPYTPTNNYNPATKKYVDDTLGSAGAVSGVKGNAESTYRSGNVNLTPANIGAMPLGGSITLTSDLTINCATGSISIVDGELNYDAGTY